MKTGIQKYQPTKNTSNFKSLRPSNPTNNSKCPTATKPKSKIPPEFDLLKTVHAADHDVLTSTPRPLHLQPAHALTLELDDDTFTPEKFALYERYQRAIHHESRHEITPRQFTRFLCNSPFKNSPASPTQRATGAYHQLYRIDGELVAFAVLDLLPDTISSVYFVYDPEKMGRFGMGKVSALREIAMCIEGGYKYYGLGTDIA